MVRQLPQTRNNGPQYHEEIPEMCNLRLRRDTGEQWGGDSCIYRAALTVTVALVTLVTLEAVVRGGNNPGWPRDALIP